MAFQHKYVEVDAYHPKYFPPEDIQYTDEILDPIMGKWQSEQYNLDDIEKVIDKLTDPEWSP